MISWRGERVVELAKMILPGDIRQRTRLPHVNDLAKQLQVGTLAALPVCRQKSRGKWMPVTGADIIAAHVLLQWPQVRVRAVVANDLEARMLALAEEKSGERDERKVAAIVAEIDAVQEQLLRDPPKPPSVKRSKRRPLAQAIHEVAKMTGLDQQSLKRAYRARKEAGEGELEVPVELEPHKLCILDLGMPIDDEFNRKVSAIQLNLTRAIDASARLTRAMVALAELPFPRRHLDRLNVLRVDLSELLAQHWPYSLCPFCKGIGGVQEACAACSMQGWIGRGQVEGVPDKLWDKVDRVVMVAGKPTRVAELLPNTELL